MKNVAGDMKHISDRTCIKFVKDQVNGATRVKNKENIALINMLTGQIDISYRWYIKLLLR